MILRWALRPLPVLTMPPIPPRGIWLESKTAGKRASSGVFSEPTGAGAIFELSRILHQFYEEVRGEEYLTFNPGNILGGTFVNYETLKSSGTAYGKSNVVAQTAVVHGGLRFISETQKENARAKMRAIVDNHLPSTNATITFTDSYPAMGPTAANKALLNELSAVSEALGFGEVEAYDPEDEGLLIFLCGRLCFWFRRIR